MDRSSGKRSKKSLKPSKHIFLGTPTNVAVGPLGFRAELDVGPKDEEDPRASRIVFRDKEREDEGTPAQAALTSGAVIGGDEQGNDPTEASPCNSSEEGGPPVVSAVPERDHKDTVPLTTVVPVDITKEVTGGFGSLNAVLETVCTNHEGTTAVRNKTDILLSHIAALEALFATRPGNVTEQGRRSDLIRKLSDIEGRLRSLCGTPCLQRVNEPVESGGDVFRLLEDLQEAISHYQIKRQKMIHEERCRLIDQAEAAILNNFRCAQAAEYRHGDRDGCMKGTRGAVLDEIELWTNDFDRPPVYWLNGLAGTGKTTIAQTIAERTFATGRLGASFFCSRDFLDRSNLQFIFPTLAIQLARKFPEFRSILVPLIQSDPGIVDETLYHQMERLIVQPLAESDVSTVIVIDALDECRDDQPASAILSVLGQFVSEVPNVKFFLTGRPEQRIREGFRLPRVAEATDVFVLHEVEPHQVESDIRLFFKYSFSELASRWPELADWPTKDQLDPLCERAAGLFAYAVATVKFIGQRNNDPEEQLDRLLKSSESSSREGRIELKEGMSLNALYMTILREAFGRDDPEDDPTTRSVLGAVALAANPLSPSSIATLLGFRIKSVSLRLSSVQSLLILQENLNHPVRPFHKSFPDFIVDPTRCTDQRFCVFPPDHHSELLIGCLELMNRRLEKNMCKLSDGVANSAVDDLRERVERCIDHGLRYACQSWHKHLVDLRTVPSHAPKITSILHRFLEEKVLFWLEVLSVLGTVRDAVDALEVAAKSLEAPPTLALIDDYFRFVTGFFEVISTSAPHIYHSALPLSPRTSIVRRLYEQYAHPFARIVQGDLMSWDPGIATIKCFYPIESIAWSPCSRFIAISNMWEKTHLLDAVTLQRLKSFRNPHFIANLLAFSPEGRSLTCFDSTAGVITSWDLQTGVRANEIFTEGSLRAPSITHSGCGTMLGVLFKDEDKAPTINTYNMISGALMFRHPIEGTDISTIWRHGDYVRFAIVGSESTTVWEVGFSSQLPPTEVETFPTSNDSYLSNQFLFHPTPPRLASITGPEKTLLVWDARYSKLLLNSTGVEDPRQMSFSSDGHFFGCEAQSGEIHLWKESPTGYILHRKLLHSETRMLSPRVFFSPNGQSMVTIGRKDLQLWRTTDSSSSTSSVPARGFQPTKNLIVGFSPDGLLAVAARCGGDTAIVLDLKSGATRLTINAGADIYAVGVARNTIAVFGDGMVTTWNLPTEGHVLGARADRSRSVQTTRLDPWEPSRSQLQEGAFFAISPGLNYVVAGRPPQTRPTIYDASTGMLIGRIESRDTFPWFTLDGRELWYPHKGWAIVRNSESNVTELEPLDRTVAPSGCPPWQSSHGYRVWDDGWVLNSTGKRLLWLPPRWRPEAGGFWEDKLSEETNKAWNGMFLTLLHSGLPEVVILEFLVE